MSRFHHILLHDPGLLPFKEISKGTSGRTEWEYKLVDEILLDIKLANEDLEKQNSGLISAKNFSDNIILCVSSNIWEYLMQYPIYRAIKNEFPDLLFHNFENFNHGYNDKNIFYLFSISSFDMWLRAVKYPLRIVRYYGI